MGGYLSRSHLVAVVVGLSVSVGAADAAAAIGDLVQKPGTAGCISQSGSSGCVDGTALGYAQSVTVSPDGANVYVASLSSDAVAVFDRAADGTLTQKPGTAGCVSETGAGPCADATALDAVESVTVSPDGRSAYAASFISGAVAVFDRAADGTLTQKAGTAGCVSHNGSGPCADGTGLGSANSVTVSPDGRSVYVTSLTATQSFPESAVAVFDRAADGTLTQKPGLAGCITGSGNGPCTPGGRGLGANHVTVSPDGASVYIAGLGVAVLDRAADGTLTQKPGLAGCITDNGSGPCADGTALGRATRSVTVSPGGDSVYVTSSDVQGGGVAVFDRAADGTLTQKPGTAGCISDKGNGGQCVDGTGLDNATSLTVSPDARNAYVTAGPQSDAVAVFDRAADGTLSQKPGLAGCISELGFMCQDGRALDLPRSVTVSPDGRSAYVASADSAAVAVFDRGPIAPPADTAAPLLSALSLSPTRFSAAASGPSIAAGAGSTVTYRLSEPAAVRFSVQRALAGRRVGGRCVKPRRSNRRAKRCTRHQTRRGAFTHEGKTGQNTFRFSGRLTARKLAPGRYRLRAIATDPLGNTSGPKHTSFQIVSG